MSDKFQREENRRSKDKYANDVEGFSVKGASNCDGMNRNRSGCTDCLFLMVFIGAMFAMIYMAEYGHRNGDVAKLLAPLDSDKHFCGVGDEYGPYPKLYIADFSLSSLNDIFGSAVCVKECPNAGDTTLSCHPGHAKECEKFAKDLTIYDTRSLMDYCIPANLDAVPKDVKDGVTKFYESFTANPIGKYVHDLTIAKNTILISILTALITCFVYIQIMSAFAETISYLLIIVMQLGFLAATAGFWYLRGQSIEKFGKMGFSDDENLSEEQQSAQMEQMLFLGMCILFGIITFGFACCICCAYSSLKFAIDVIDASADFLAGTKRIILVPGLFFILSMLSIFIWAGCLVCVLSLNEIQPHPVIPQAKKLIWEDYVFYMALYMLFGILWLCAWFEYLSEFITQVSAATYYFNSDAEHEGSAEVGLGFHYAFMNHPGSIAIGAFIIALIRFVRIIFIYLAQQMKKQSGDNPAVRYGVMCAECILHCLEKICDYINASAYAYMAVTGDSFCTSAWNGFLLNVKHMLKFAFANMIAKVFTFLGKVAITFGNMFLCLMIMKYGTGTYNDVTSVFGPLAAVGLVSFMTASIFLGMFDDAVQALMTCLAIDLDLHDGECKYGPPTFHDRIKKIHQAEDDEFEKVHEEEEEA